MELVVRGDRFAFGLDLGLETEAGVIRAGSFDRERDFEDIVLLKKEPEARLGTCMILCLMTGGAFPGFLLKFIVGTAARALGLVRILERLLRGDVEGVCC